MVKACVLLIVTVWLAHPYAGQQPASPPAASSLNYEVFKAKVQPILTSPRKGQRPLHGLSLARRRQ